MKVQVSLTLDLPPPDAATVALYEKHPGDDTWLEDWAAQVVADTVFRAALLQHASAALSALSLPPSTTSEELRVRLHARHNARFEFLSAAIPTLQIQTSL